MKTQDKNEGERVLVALDYGPTAQKVAEMGFSLSKAMNTEIILLHIISNVTYYSTLGSSPIFGFNDFSYTDFNQIIDLDGVEKASQYFLDKIKHHLGDESIITLVDEGDPAEVILKTAKHLQVGIIVMGSHSRRWLEQILLGSVTEKVLRNTSLPLFIIPTKGHNS